MRWSQHKGSNAHSVSSSSVVDEGRTLVHVSFSALTLLVGWLEGHPAREKLCYLFFTVFLWSEWRQKNQWEGTTSWSVLCYSYMIADHFCDSLTELNTRLAACHQHCLDDRLTSRSAH